MDTNFNENNFQYIPRDLETTILNHLNKKKVIVLYGARQTGKTTLLRNLFARTKTPYLYLSCEENRVAEQLIPDSLALKKIIGNNTFLVFDEAQRLPNPGLILKILIDNGPYLNIIASGSSSFNLANKLSEPLTGRCFQFQLFSLSFGEIKKYVKPIDFKFHLQNSLIFGSYPEIFKLESEEEKINHLNLLTDNYLYRDILAFNLVKNSRKIRELLIALSLQLGSEVSYHELANTLSVNRKTVENYLDLLEKSFVIFRLYGFSRNLRSEINRKVKIYFYDLGVRNALINNFNSLNLRNDSGPIFENYAIAEKVKINANLSQRSNLYFWRTYEEKEIDLIEERNGKIFGFEFKMKSGKTAFAAFQKAYPQSSLRLVVWEDIGKFLFQTSNSRP